MTDVPSIDQLNSQINRDLESGQVTLDDLRDLFDAFSIDSIFELTRSERIAFVSMLKAHR